MHITFIEVKMTHYGKSKFSQIRFEPTIYAKLKALTPDDIEYSFIDTRLKDIDFTAKTDIVVMSLTTMNAKYGYEIADEYRKRNIKVILGGIHVNLCPNEALEHADCIAIGEAEMIWSQIMENAKNNNLQKIYKSDKRYDMRNYKIDFSIFKGIKYFPVRCIETSRGCLFNCKFCSLAPMYNQKIVYRDADEVANEIKSYKHKLIVFLDENFGNSLEHTSAILEKIIPLKKKWSAQMSVNSLQNKDFVKLMKKSGCFNVFVGFESPSTTTLKVMNKASNYKTELYKTALNNCIENNIAISGGFIHNYLNEAPQDILATWEFANSFQFFNCSYVNVIPFPGTPVYNSLKEQNLLVDDKWWMSDINYYNLIPIYRSTTKAPKEMPEQGFDCMNEFFTFKYIIKRFLISKYKWKMRIFILLANIFYKFTFTVIGA